MPVPALVLAFVVILAAVPAHAQIGDILKKIGVEKETELTDQKITSGLKEALRVGTDNTVKSTGREDGYFGNQAIKILMPEDLRTLEKGLRAVGYDDQVDDFILSMNRAAERAAPQAKDIFWDAILEMSFDDARRIWSGNETAATDYFKEKTSDRLTEAFRPIVADAMNEVGVTQQYKELVGRAERIPFLRFESLDVDEYVVGKALDGLFHVLGEEERKIRREPAARVTQLLKDVFGD
jgi:hypothetical protein